MDRHDIHGGKIYEDSDYIDFSANINPLGLNNNIKSQLYNAIEKCKNYSDIYYKKLQEELAVLEGCPPEWIRCGNGASELIMAIVHAFRPEKTMIPVPSFYGYERSVMAAEGEIDYYYLKEEDNFELTEDFCKQWKSGRDLLFLANPNNPTGVRIQTDLLDQIVGQCRDNGTIVVLDECFYDFLLDKNWHDPALQAAKFDNLIIVRAFTKIFAMPGVRLGYCLSSNQRLLDRLEAHLPEWNVSTFAQEAGIAACREQSYRDRTPLYVANERFFLEEGLKNLQKKGLWDLKIYPGEANFLLMKTQIPLYNILKSRKIIIRDCANFRGLGEGYYRIAVRTREENQIFLRELESSFC